MFTWAGVGGVCGVTNLKNPHTRSHELYKASLFFRRGDPGKARTVNAHVFVSSIKIIGVTRDLLEFKKNTPFIKTPGGGAC